MHRLFASIVLLALSSVSFAAETTLKERTWTVDGVARQALVHVPPAASQSPTPLVFAFHGHGGNMNQAARSFSYHTVWPEAVVVYMQGLNTPGKLTDPEGKRPGWQSGRGDQQDRDLKFFDAVLASLKSDYKIDDQRIYATGHSNGGSFTYLLWSMRGDTFAAMAPSAAVPGLELLNLKPKPVLHVASETDPLVKWEWQKRTIDRLVKLNDCEADGTEWAKSGDLVCTIHASKTGTPLVKAIGPGGHRFPQEAPALIVKFFKEHSRPDMTKPKT
jgi:polyhydroxybutyrate depolymerase